MKYQQRKLEYWYQLILEDYELKTWQVIIPKDDQTLKRELLRSFLNYLGVEQKVHRPSQK